MSVLVCETAERAIGADLAEALRSRREPMRCHGCGGGLIPEVDRVAVVVCSIPAPTPAVVPLYFHDGVCARPAYHVRLPDVF